MDDLFSLNTDICESRHGGNAESVAAHETVIPRKKILRAQIMRLAERRGAYGLTTEECALELRLPYTTASARVSELKAEGALIPTDRKRKTRAGCNARVLVARGGAQ